MKKRILHRLVAFSLATVMTIGVTVSATASEARLITVHNISGDSVELSRGARATAPRQGQRLAQGNVLTTGRDSSVYLSMDSDSILKMDQQSQVVVSSAGNRLALTVQSGSALLDVGVQQAGHTTEVRIGNTGLTVRGTMFTVSRVGDVSVIHMLSGLGEAEAGMLHAGYTMVVTQQAGGDISRIYPTVFEELDRFTLQVIADNAEYLSTYGIATPELLDALPTLKDQAETRENSIQASVDRALATAVANVTGDGGQVGTAGTPSTSGNVEPTGGGGTAGGGTPSVPPTPPASPGGGTPSTPPSGGIPPASPDNETQEECEELPYTSPTPPEAPSGVLVPATMSRVHGGGGSGNTNWVNMNGAATHVPPIQAIGGDTITIFAGYRPGYVFAGWTTHYHSFTFADPSSPTTTFIMPHHGNAVVNATWTPR
ncbi:MAG: FecR domain-containing protein [Defluviitaleaceae bacterium]|nr:FecR domain-containing protein [Defluviitaleaceae bacterium]